MRRGRCLADHILVYRRHQSAPPGISATVPGRTHGTAHPRLPLAQSSGRTGKPTPSGTATAPGLHRIFLGTPAQTRFPARTGSRSQWFGYTDDEREAEGIAEQIQDLLEKDGVPPSEIAVLFRTNGQSGLLEAALADRGIPYQLRGAEQFFDRPEIKQAMLALRASAKSTDGSENVPRYVREVLEPLGYTEKAPQSAGAVRQKWESLAAIVSMVDHLEDTRIEDIAQAEAAGAPVPHRLTVHDVVATLAHRLATQDAPVMEGVTLASLHSAKGLEWDAVFLCGLNEGLMPITFAQTSDEIDEERRLLYVGITRARKYLWFTWSDSRTAGGRGKRRRSRFLDDIDPSRQSARHS